MIFEGEFFKLDNKSVIINATLTGKIIVECNRTLQEFEENIDEKYSLLIYDGEYKGFNKDYDVIETFDGFINFDEILESEIELIKSDYHYIDKCEDEFIYKET